MSSKKAHSKRTAVHAARGVHKPRGGGSRRLELQGLRGSALDLMHGQFGWKKKLPVDVVYRVVQEEVINDHLSFLEKFIKNGELPADWERDFADVEWYLCDYPIHLLSVPLGLMEPNRATAYRNRDPKTRPPIILDFNNRIVQGRHRLVGAFMRGETSILAYVPQRVGSVNKLISKYGIDQKIKEGEFDNDTHGRYSPTTRIHPTPRLIKLYTRY